MKPDNANKNTELWCTFWYTVDVLQYIFFLFHQTLQLFWIFCFHCVYKFTLPPLRLTQTFFYTFYWFFVVFIRFWYGVWLFFSHSFLVCVCVCEWVTEEMRVVARVMVKGKSNHETKTNKCNLESSVCSFFFCSSRQRLMSNRFFCSFQTQ